MPMMVCVQCHSFLKVKKNGVGVEELAPMGDRHSATWHPYKLWVADLYGCERCGIEVVAGFGVEPVAEHYKPDYPRWRQRFPPVASVDDCTGMYDPNSWKLRSRQSSDNAPPAP